MIGRPSALKENAHMWHECIEMLENLNSLKEYLNIRSIRSFDFPEAKCVMEFSSSSFMYWFLSVHVAIG